MNVVGSILLLFALWAAAMYVFARVNSDYQTHDKLSRTTAVIQTAYFFAYMLSSYAFLDARFSQINRSSLLFPMAVGLMLGGFLIIILAMPFLGLRSFGTKVGTLNISGLYHYSRNPQLIGGFLLIAGYALLWPSWGGMAWVSLWFVITSLMVEAEEVHLEKVFGDEYLDYCTRTPRYLELPKG